MGGFRSFEQVYNNEECYKEDFVYSVDKFNNTFAGNPSQTFYVPAVDDTSIVNDTQIKYDKIYYYRCKAHYIIVGNKYRYENLKIHTDKKNIYATVQVINRPSVILVPVCNV